MISYYPISVTETMTSSETVLDTIQKRLSDVITEGDSQIDIQVTMGDIKVSSQITDIVKDIRVIDKAVRNMKYVYCNRSVNKSADGIIRIDNQLTSQTLVFYHE